MRYWRRSPRSIHFICDWDVKLIGSSFAKLPRRSSAWYSPVGPWNIFQDPEDLLLPDVHTIVTPANFVKTSCPVTASTTDEFTREQRDIAEDADVAQDLEELEELVLLPYIQFRPINRIDTDCKPRPRWIPRWRQVH
jgi:hypothetical protein